MELEPGNDYASYEKNVKKFLKSLPDDKLKNFYEAIEYTPFPVLLSKEYRRRFPQNRPRTKKGRTEFL